MEFEVGGKEDDIAMVVSVGPSDVMMISSVGG